MKKISILVCMLLLFSVFVVADNIMIKKGETKSIGGVDVKVTSIENQRKVMLLIGNEEVLMRKGIGNKHEIDENTYFYLDSAMNNYMEPWRSLANFEVVGVEVVEETTSVIGPERRAVVIQSGESKVLNGVEIGLERVRDGLAFMLVNGKRVELGKEYIYDDDGIDFRVEGLLDNTLDERYDKVEIIMDVESEEAGSGVDVERPEPELKKGPDFKPVKQESKSTNLPEPGGIEEDLNDPEDLSEDEEGFWDVLFGWLMFWK